MSDSIPHLPALRLGRPYDSLEKVEIRDHRTGNVMALVSQVNGGVVKRDLGRLAGARGALRRHSVSELRELSARAGDLFLNGTLALGDRGHTQSADQYVDTLSRTSGLPHVMVRRNMAKIHYALTHLGEVLNGLSRGLDFTILDRGYGEQFGTKLSFFPTCQALGLVMPSNSPAVNSLWLPAIALKTPVVIKPGREEPWTPYRLIQAFIAAGVPAEAFGFYPTDHDGAATILNACGRALIFGDKSTTAQYANNPAIQIHGPGWSKFLIGEDCIGNWPEYVEVIASAIADNGGRSCINASAVVVPRFGAEIADALAQRLGPVQPTRPDDEHARLSGFANPKMADFIEGQIEEGFKTPGAVEATAVYRDGPRRTVFEGGTYLRPTIVRCDSFDHPLANREFLCPYASVVTCPQPEMLSRIGYTLACSAITKEPGFIAELEAYPHIERLNIGPVSTMKISWDQPHEGNMFEFLWQRRSIERAW
ncbi:MAG: aldehyde dehydrogenase [Verrucomicrobiae bacterium]|nr:aldehyde dehydrogenase [Verrucomicrobiae bacterium]